MGFNSGFKGLKSDNNNGTLHADRYTFLIISRSVLLRMRNVSHKNKNKIKTILYFIFKLLFSKIWWDNVEKFCRAGQATNYNMAHIYYKLNT